MITHKYVEKFDGQADDYEFVLLSRAGHFPQEEESALVLEFALPFLGAGVGTRSL